MGLIPPSFFWRAIRVAQKKNGCTGGGVLPSSTTVTKDVRSLATYPGIRADQVFKVQWLSPLLPPAEPLGKEWMVFIIHIISTIKTIQH